MAKKVSFEQNLDKLEKMVMSLENGELTLDESIKNFEAGVNLYNECKSYLGEVEKKVDGLQISPAGRGETPHDWRGQATIPSRLLVLVSQIEKKK